MAGLNSGKERRRARAITGGAGRQEQPAGDENLLAPKKAPGKAKLSEPTKVKGFTLFLSLISRMDQYEAAQKANGEQPNASAITRDLWDKFLTEKGF